MSGTHSWTDPPSDPEEILPVANRESAITFGDIGCNRESGTVELIDKKIEPARKCLRELASAVGKVDGLLIDEKFLERESHQNDPAERSK